jgi:ketosteroid isomerase-like protein
MTLYKKDACFASKPGQVVQDLGSLRRSLRGFIDMKGKLDPRVRRVIQAGNLALLITEWSIAGTEPDGKPIKITGRNTVDLRSQFDGSWLMVIESPWGTD